MYELLLHETSAAFTLCVLSLPGRLYNRGTLSQLEKGQLEEDQKEQM